jgi:hypothetical protein
MPGNLAPTAPNGVLPFFLCTAFVGTREYVQLQNQYHDGTIQRSQLAQTSRRVYRPTMRMTATALAALYSFLETQNFGLIPFIFYDPFDVPAGAQIGSNYDPAGNNPQGQVIVRAQGNWAQSTDLCRSNVSGLALVEVE